MILPVLYLASIKIFLTAFLVGNKLPSVTVVSQVKFILLASGNRDTPE